MRLINVEVAAPRDFACHRRSQSDLRGSRFSHSIETGDRRSRDLHEWREHDGPYTIVFFNQKPYAPTTSQETHEWSRVLDLRQELSERGLAEAFLGDEEFVRRVGARLKGLARQIAIDIGVVEFGVVAASPATTVPQVIPNAFSCSVVSTMPSIRAEGLTELLGEIGLIFSGELLFCREVAFTLCGSSYF